MTLEGELRRDHSATLPWQYSGHVTLPAGRIWGIQGRVAEDAVGKYFILAFSLVPGMNAEELEAALVACERSGADKARREIYADTSDELPF